MRGVGSRDHMEGGESIKFVSFGWYGRFNR